MACGLSLVDFAISRKYNVKLSTNDYLTHCGSGDRGRCFKMAANSGRGKKRQIIAIQAIILAVCMVILAFVEVKYLGSDHDELQKELLNPESKPPVVAVTPKPQKPVETPTPTPEPTPTPMPEFEPYAVEETMPEKFISATAIQVNGEKVESYEVVKEIDFGMAEDFSTVPGVLTFRGNNFRDGGAYGTANLSEKKFSQVWTRGMGSLTAYNGYTWTGSGWTGQALIADWDKETRAVMNMYDWAKEQENLVEVIHATMDGNVYFTELSTGKQTRDNLYLGFTFKGAGSLDPRGYPILYVGAGYYGAYQSPRALAISLIDGSILFELAANENFALRQWHMFDSAPLVCAETDQLIWPGENGVLYIVNLNTNYDEAAGTLTVEPEIVKWRYQSIRNTATGGQYWLGMEGSAITYSHYLFMADNGGHFMCLDLNTLELVWVQDVLDDTNCTPVLEFEDGHPYLYISTSFHAGWRSWSTADIPIWKIDAVTGEIIWQTPYTCYTEPDLSGGVQGSIAVGKNALSDLIFVPVARTPNAYGGVLAALNKETGEVVWELKTQTYSWSSPVCVYDDAGNGYLLYCTSGVGNSSGGYLNLVDGLTGKILYEVALGSTTEASPVVYNDMVVIGTRGQTVYGFKLK